MEKFVTPISPLPWKIRLEAWGFTLEKLQKDDSESLPPPQYNVPNYDHDVVTSKYSSLIAAEFRNLHDLLINYKWY